MGATCSRAPLRFSSSHSTSVSSLTAMRSAICRTSSTMPRACCRAASPSMSAFSLGNDEKQARAESRTRARASSSRSPGMSMRPGSVPAITSDRASAASVRSSTAVPTSTWARARRAARSIIAGSSSSVAACVTRAASSCASSTMTASYSGSIGTPSMASMASSAWLVTTRSACWASSRARSAKHSSACAHRDAPRHSRWLTLTCRQARSVCAGAESLSAISPAVACSSAHSRSSSTSPPSDPSGTSTSTPWSSGAPSRMRCRQA